MKIIIGGALGRMGREVLAMAEAEGIQVACGVDVACQGSPAAIPVVKEYAEIAESADVLIDFSRPDGLESLLNFCESRKMPCVLCATGYTEAQEKRIANAARDIPILRSANMSLGVNVMEQLLTTAAKALREDFDIEIVEKHHRMKADSPSGTALMLYEAVKKGMDREANPVFGRHSVAEKREKGDVGIHAVRGGTVTGEHEVGFYGNGEQIILIHRAESRVLFAQGAVKAARFLQGKPAGLYSMKDVVAEILA